MTERVGCGRAARLAALAAMGLLAGCGAGDAELDGAVNPSRAEAIRVGMPPCGTVLASFDGTHAYSNGANTGTGNSCAGYGRYGLQYQCVELVMRHFTTHWGLHWNGNAKYLLDNAPRRYVDVYDNGDGAHPPVPGDMVVWTAGVYGHVALVSEVTATRVRVIEENAAGSGTTDLAWDGAHLGPRWGSWIPAGWAHAKANTATPVAPPSPPPIADAGAPPTADASAPPTGPEACGRYASWDVRTCLSATEMARCTDGVLRRTACAPGGRCLTRPDGFDDVCLPPAGEGEPCGDNAWIDVFTCDRAHTQRMLCVDGRLLREACPHGCVTRPRGVDDVCAP